MATQIQQLPTNIDKLLDTVYKLKEKSFLVPPIPKIPIQTYLMTPRQIAKKIILVSSGAITAAGDILQASSNDTNTIITSASALGADIPNNNPMNNYDTQFALNASQMIGQIVTPESAHFIVYGKFKRDVDGNLIDNEIKDPDCVFTKLAMPSSHPTFTEIQVMIMKVTRTLTLLPIKQKDMLDDIAQAMIAIPASIVSIASAAAILPPGAGIPVAFSAFQGLMANIMNVVAKISGVATECNIEYLNYLPLLVEAQKIDALIGIINAQLIAINTILMTIDGLTKIIPSVPTPPGVGNQPGEPVTLEVKANPTSVTHDIKQNVTLSATASKGSWEYNYQWLDNTGKVLATKKDLVIIDGPFTTTTYTCKVTDKKDSANSVSSDITVLVI
jgi:hypothetical protein